MDRLEERSPAGSETAGLAHVATLSFIAARASGPLGFPLSLAGGVALARAGERGGPRGGYGVGLGALLETVAIVGPARLGGPVTQALTAPLVGVMERRGASRALGVVAVAAIRFAYTAIGALALIFLAGGLDAYTATYDSLLGWLPVLPAGRAAALAATGFYLVAWSLVAAAIQVSVFRRARRRWPAARAAPATARSRAHTPGRESRFDPRAIALAAIVAFALLLIAPSWALVAAVAAWLAFAWMIAPPEREVLPSGLALAAILAAITFTIGCFGGGLASGAIHACRAALLVLTATWLRGATGAAGFHEVTRRALDRLHRVPAFAEAKRTLEELGTGRRLGAAARSLRGSLAACERRRPGPLIDAALGWIAFEAQVFRPVAAMPALELRLGGADLFLVCSSLAPAVAVVLG